MIAKIILFLSIAMGSGILVANVYTSIVDATSWGANIPDSLYAARAYFKVVNPGTFFKAISPVALVLTLLVLVLFWNSAPSARIYFAINVGCYILMTVFTINYFYPRNDIMFLNGTDIEAMSKAWSQWNAMNWVRSLIMFVGLCASFVGLDKIYSNLATN